MELHRNLLANDEYLQLVYNVLSDSIYNFHQGAGK
jgi:hypothetical protein